MPRAHRVAGALIGAAVGDALGAPFRSGPPGQFSARFPTEARGARTEMCGGGPDDRAPGEVTDEIREALLAGTDPATALPALPEPVLADVRAALQTGRSFADVLRLVLDAGGDTAATGRVAGGLAGGVYGIAGIPIRWTSALHGRVPGQREPVLQLAELHHLAAALDGSTAPPYEAPETRGLQPREVAPGVWAADLDGARSSSPEFAVVSLCRTGSRFRHEVQRFAYLTDDDANSELDAVLDDVLAGMTALRAEGRPVLVHCFAGQSRTGLVLRAWLRRTEGMSAAEATAYVRGRWPHLSEWNDTFTAALERMR